MSAFRITRTSTPGRSTYLSPFARWPAFPASDYYEDSVPLRLAPGRGSRVPHAVDVRGWFRCPVRALEMATGHPATLGVRESSPGDMIRFVAVRRQWSGQLPGGIRFRPSFLT